MRVLLWFVELEVANSAVAGKLIEEDDVVKNAFDSVPHIHLMNKLSALQLCPQIIHWLHS